MAEARRAARATGRHEYPHDRELALRRLVGTRSVRDGLAREFARLTSLIGEEFCALFSLVGHHSRFLVGPAGNRPTTLSDAFVQIQDRTWEIGSRRTLAEMARRAVLNSTEVSEIRSGIDPVLHDRVADAFRVAELLARELGAGTSLPVRPDAVTPGVRDWVRRYRESLCHIRGVVASAVDEAVNRLRCGSGSSDTPAQILWIQKTDDEWFVTGLGEGTEPWAMPLSVLIDRAAHGAGRQLDEQLQSARELLEESSTMSRDAWERICPEHGSRIVAALAEDQAAELVLFRLVADRGLRVEVSLRLRCGLDPMDPIGGCSLHVRRSHAEFVLQSEENRLFYFPPTQLSAVLFHGIEAREWSVRRPLVRVPSGPAWNHPYTGPLKIPLTRMRLIHIGDDGGPAPTVPPSEDALHIVPGLADAMSKPSGPREGDICLNGQEVALAAYLSRLCAATRQMRAGEEDAGARLLAVVRGCWEIARQGLIRAHQLNVASPRVRMVPGQMPYSLPPGTTLPPALERRCYRYAGVNQSAAGE
jgi:hypothetical protein